MSLKCPIFVRSKGKGKFCEEIHKNVCAEHTWTSRDGDGTTYRGKTHLGHLTYTSLCRLDAHQERVADLDAY